MTKSLSDVLEYLYKNNQKELAEAVIAELRNKRDVTYIPTPRPQKIVDPFKPITYWGRNGSSKIQQYENDPNSPSSKPGNYKNIWENGR